MVPFHLRQCAINHHRLSSDFIFMASLFKTNSLSIPSIPTAPSSLQTHQLFHTHSLLLSNNYPKPTPNFSPFSLCNSGFCHFACPSVPPPVSLEGSTGLSARLRVLRKKLKELGFEDREYMPGLDNNLLCPMCKGGNSGVTSLSLHISENGNSAAWICFRGKCDWHGNTMAFSNAQSSSVKLNETINAYGPLSYGELNQTIEAKKRELTEKNLKLEPLCDELLAYFAERRISEQTLRRNHVMQKRYPGQIVIAFTYKRNGTLVNCKYRSLAKRFWQERDAERVFYGLDDIQNASDIIIVEGELDKLSMEEAGFRNCVSAPNGAPSKVSTKVIPAPVKDKSYQYLWNCKEYFDKASRIILATDGDPPGQALAEELARRLGRERCWQVKWPKKNEDNFFKDANEVLVHLGPGLLKETIENAEPYPMPE